MGVSVFCNNGKLAEEIESESSEIEVAFCVRVEMRGENDGEFGTREGISDGGEICVLEEEFEMVNGKTKGGLCRRKKTTKHLKES